MHVQRVQECLVTYVMHVKSLSVEEFFTYLRYECQVFICAQSAQKKRGGG